MVYLLAVTASADFYIKFYYIITKIKKEPPSIFFERATLSVNVFPSPLAHLFVKSLHFNKQEAATFYVFSLFFEFFYFIVDKHLFPLYTRLVGPILVTPQEVAP
jgi:hypothetical protein